MTTIEEMVIDVILEKIVDIYDMTELDPDVIKVFESLAKDGDRDDLINKAKEIAKSMGNEEMVEKISKLENINVVVSSSTTGDDDDYDYEDDDGDIYISKETMKKLENLADSMENEEYKEKLKYIILEMVG